MSVDSRFNESGMDEFHPVYIAALAEVMAKFGIPAPDRASEAATATEK